MGNLKKYFFAAALAGVFYLGMGQWSLSMAQLSFENGNFESFDVTSTDQAADGGSGLNTTSNTDPDYTTGSTLTGWTNTAYAFVFTTSNSLNGGTIQGSGGTAPPSGTAFALWSSDVRNGGRTGLAQVTEPPGGGNVVALDAAYEVGTLSQNVTGLVKGDTYQVTFEWAASQQAGYNTTTSDSVSVNMGGTFNTTNNGDQGYFTGGTTHTTTTVDLPARGFSGWMTQSFDFTATATSETLSFLANGGPDGDPPFVLLADVQMVEVPEPVATSFWTLLFGIAIMFGNRAWRRYRIRPSTNTS